MTERLTPTDVAVRLLGGVGAVAVAVSRHETTIYNWTRASAERDAGDIPGGRHQRRIAAACARLGLDRDAVTVALVHGATEAEVAALVARRRPARADDDPCEEAAA